MTSFIIYADTLEHAEAKAHELCQEHHIDQFDTTVIAPDDKVESATKSLGIEVVKNMQKMVFYKPLKSEYKAVMLKQAHLLTVPAQNALLKLLEEPPDHTLLFLLTTQMDVLLPTILSRCTVISLQTTQETLSNDERAELHRFLLSLPKQTVGDLLKKAQDLAKQKEETATFLQGVTVVARETLLEQANNDTVDVNLVRQLSLLQQTYRTLNTTSINIRMALESLFLSLRSM